MKNIIMFVGLVLVVLMIWKCKSVETPLENNIREFYLDFSELNDFKVVDAKNMYDVYESTKSTFYSNEDNYNTEFDIRNKIIAEQIKSFKSLKSKIILFILIIACGFTYMYHKWR